MAEDLYKKRASKVFGVAYQEVTPEQRQWVKAKSFGLMYSSRFTSRTGTEKPWTNDDEEWLIKVLIELKPKVE